MFRVYSCLTTDHDLRYVALAAVVCLLASGTAMGLLQRLSHTRGLRRAGWLAVAASVIGGGVWATHFVALLGFKTGLPVAYDYLGTIGSLLVAVCLLAVAIETGLHPKRGRQLLGGAAAGASVAVMHYTGMAAYVTQGVLHWDLVLVAASVLLGAAFGAASLVFAQRDGLPNQVAATLLFTLAVCSVHFPGMAAVTITPDPTVVIPASAIDDARLAFWVAGASSALLAVSLIALLTGRHQRIGSARRLRELADAAVEGLAICEDGRIVTANESLQRITGLSSADLSGRVLSTLFAEAEAVDDLSPGERLESALRNAEGERVPVELLTHKLVFDGRPRLAVAVRDLRDRVAAEAKIRFLAHHDGLTNLPNRQSFSDRISRELQLHRRRDDTFAVLCLDLDRFKQVNDVLGHAAGDAVLKAVAERITGLLDEDDMFARLGGDEFAILRLHKCHPVELAALADAILAAIPPDIDVGGGQIAAVGVSLGVAIFPQDGADADVLMRNADAALYQAKQTGRDRYCFFEAELAAQLLARQRQEFDLRQALARREFHVVYQPQAYVKGHEIFGFEALLRWNSPSRGDVPRVDFIPLAEETGLILPIGEWVLREACTEAVRWPKPLQVAVNLSGVQLRSPTLARRVHEILLDTGLPAERLELEITETALIEDFDLALHTLRQLKTLGVKIAMDDFGTGYSSLSNLRAFPFDKIKIDRSFVQNVDENAQTSTIVRAILGLCRGLNLSVLAEGVESEGELAFLADEHCLEAQGYLFGAPGAIADFPAAFEDMPPRPAAEPAGLPVRRAG